MTLFTRFALIVASLVFLIGAAVAAPYQVVPYVYDPDNTGAIVSAWQSGIGLTDGGGKNDPYAGLVFQKNTSTYTNAAAWADITGVKGILLTELGWDMRNDSHNGAGAPRFNVDTDAGTYYFLGSYYADKTPAPADPANWTRARFTDADVYPAYADQPAWPGFGKALVYKLELVFDEGTDQGERLRRAGQRRRQRDADRQAGRQRPGWQEEVTR